MDKSQKIQFTPEGLEDLKQELEKLKEEKRPEAVERVSRAREYGDLSENSEYHAAREDLSFVQGRIEELEDILKKAQVVKKQDNSKVAIGSEVTISADGKEHTYELVGEWEADPAKKKISHTSPLGGSLIGKKKGEEVKVEAPAGKITYEIKKIQ